MLADRTDEVVRETVGLNKIAADLAAEALLLPRRRLLHIARRFGRGSALLHLVVIGIGHRLAVFEKLAFQQVGQKNNVGSGVEFADHPAFKLRNHLLGYIGNAIFTDSGLPSNLSRSLLLRNPNLPISSMPASCARTTAVNFPDF